MAGENREWWLDRLVKRAEETRNDGVGTTARGRPDVLKGCSVAAVVLLGSCWFAFYSMTTEVIEAYRPDYQVRSLTADSLARSLVELRHGSVTLLLNWSTRDSPRPGRGPYNFEVVVRPMASNFRALVFDSIRISSDQTEYSLEDSSRPPLRLERSARAWHNHVFEPAFPFDHGGGEVVTTRMWYRVVNTFDSIPQYEELRWVPIRTKRFVPIV